MNRHPGVRVLALLPAAGVIGAAVVVTLPDRPAPARSGDPAVPGRTAPGSVPAPGAAVDPAAAYRRAAAYATTKLAAALMRASPRRLPYWQELAAHPGRMHTRVGDDAGEPPPGRAGITHHAVVVVTTTSTGAGGWTGRSHRHIVYRTLTPTRSGSQWLVAGYCLEWRRLP
jgi:hypothetical protein